MMYYCYCVLLCQLRVAFESIASAIHNAPGVYFSEPCMYAYSITYAFSLTCYLNMIKEI